LAIVVVDERHASRTGAPAQLGVPGATARVGVDTVDNPVFGDV